MIGRLRGLVQAARRRPWLATWVAVLLAGASLSAYSGGWWLWGASQRRAVQRALDRRDFADARARLERCLQSWPHDADWRLLAARAARQDGDYQEAERQLDRCERLGGDQKAITLERAMLAVQADGMGRAEGYLLARLEKKPPEANLIFDALTQGYLKTQRLPEALHCLDRWLEHQPDHVPALLWRGQLLERWNAPGEAVASYRRAVAAAPEDEKARRLLALALVRSDRASEALEHLESLARENPDPEILLGLARARRCLGQADEAHRLLDRILAEQPNNAEALAERGKLALEAGRTAEAEAALAKALALSPYDRETNYTYYLCLRHLGRDTDAARALATVDRIRADLQRVSELRRKIADSPRDASLRCEVGLIFLRNGQKQEGLRWLQSALQLDPGHAQARQALTAHAPPKDQRQ